MMNHGSLNLEKNIDTYLWQLEKMIIEIEIMIDMGAIKCPIKRPMGDDV